MQNSFGTSPLEILACDAMLQSLIYCEEFDYVLTWEAGTATELGANGTRALPLQIDGSSDFIVQAYNLIVYEAGAIVADPNLLISFTRDSSGRKLNSQPVHVRNCTGNYSADHIPGVLGFPVLLASQSTFDVSLINLTATVYDRIDLDIRGFKVYYTPAAAVQRGMDSSQAARNATRTAIFHVL